jgi:hypothetical protein
VDGLFRCPATLPRTGLLFRAGPDKAASKATQQRQSEVSPVGLTRGQVNAVRAAFKAGVTPARIARQFGLSQSQVRKALMTDETRR